MLHLAPDEVLRNALDGLLRSEVQYAAVLNGDGRARGVLSVGAIHDFLASEEQG